MKSSMLKHIGIATAALIAVVISGVVLWLLYGSALAQPERKLPKDTAYLLRDVQPRQQTILRSWFPVLGANATSQPAPSNAVKPNDSLWESPTYQALIPTKRPDAAWLYMNPAAFNTPVTAWPWLKPTFPFALSLNDQSISIAMETTAAIGLPRLTTTLPMAFAKPLFVVRGEGLPALWQHASPLVDEAMRAPFESRLLQKIQAITGKDVSVRYDLAPLVVPETTVHLGTEGTGSTLRFLVEGSTDAGGMKQLTSIMEGFRASLPATKRETLIFSEGEFASDTLAEDPQSIEDRTTTVNGWKMRMLRQKGTNRALLLVTKGDQFIIGDSETALLTRIRNTLPPLTFSGLNGELMVAGMAARSFLPDLRLPATFGATAQWSVTVERSRLLLRVESLP